MVITLLFLETYLTTSVLPWLSFAVFLVVLYVKSPRRSSAPGPSPLPFFGSLHLLGKHSSPFQAFSALSQKYGPIFSIVLGSSPCVVVNNFPLIREVLVTKGSEFAGRPDFIRYHQLFGGDRNKSLALCDWSDLQKKRRSISLLYCAPRLTSTNFERLSEVASEEATYFLTELQSLPTTQNVELKPFVMAACANMFTSYMCTKRFSYQHEDFRNIVCIFDEVFYEVNQGYAVDFLPWLLPFYKSHMNRLCSWSQSIRTFIMNEIIAERSKELEQGIINSPRDFTDALLIGLKEDKNQDWLNVIFQLEDFLGGHSAIGNLVMHVLANVAKDPKVARRIAEEVDAVTGGCRNVEMTDKPKMPYTEACLWETLRVASSPIVPHVATTDTSIDGHSIPKGTVVFLNNYGMNTSSKFWTNAEKFQPERFIVDNKIVKPDNFIPYSMGKRICIGQRLVQNFSFVLVATLVQHFEISADPASIVTTPACVALPPKTFSLNLTARRNQGC